MARSYKKRPDPTPRPGARWDAPSDAVKRACAAHPRRRAMEVRGFIRAYLDRPPFAASPGEIAHRFRVAYSQHLKDTVVSQQLEMLRRDGAVTRLQQGVWALVRRVRPALVMQIADPTAHACLWALCRVSGFRDLHNLAEATGMRPRSHLKALDRLEGRGLVRATAINNRAAWRATSAGRAIFPELDAESQPAPAPTLADLLA